MRRYNIYVKTAIAVFAVVLSACSSDNDVVENNPVNPKSPVSDNTMTFSASMDAGNDTRTDFDNNNSTIWTETDSIKIVNRATITDTTGQGGYKWYGNFKIVKHTGETPAPYTKKETFSGTRIQSNGSGNDSFYAFYPATCPVGYATGQDIAEIKGEVKTSQTAMPNTYDQTLHFMTAHSSNTTFSFKNVCALLKITLANSNISRVKVVANPTQTNVYDQNFTYKYITGKFKSTVSKVDGTTSDILPNKGDNETQADVQKTYVELLPATGKTIIENGTYYMVVLPVDIPNGFTLTLETSDGSTIYQRISSKITKFERNEMYNLGTYDINSLPSSVSTLTNVVDLDLPSGTIWCTKNIKKNGAFDTKASDNTDWFSWGKTSVTAGYSLPTLTNKTLRVTEDVAYQGDNDTNKDHCYCMPTYAQIYELYYKIHSKTKNTLNSVTCAKFTSASGKSIYLPYAGYYYALDNREEGDQVRYWSRTYAGEYWYVAKYYDYSYCLAFDNSFNLEFSNWYDKSMVGYTIRPVAANFKIAKLFDGSGNEITW